MSRSTSRAAARPLPPGLRICPTCREARGTTPDGMVSACFCSGLVCNRCGQRARRPITDYFDRRDGSWWHVPWCGVMGHTCRLRPGEESRGTGWTHLERDPDVVAYQEAVTRLALAELEERLARDTDHAMSTEPTPLSPARRTDLETFLDEDGREDETGRAGGARPAAADDPVPARTGRATQGDTTAPDDGPSRGGKGEVWPPDPRRDAGRRS